MTFYTLKTIKTLRVGEPPHHPLEQNIWCWSHYPTHPLHLHLSQQNFTGTQTSLSWGCKGISQSHSCTEPPAENSPKALLKAIQKDCPHLQPTAAVPSRRCSADGCPPPPTFNFSFSTAVVSPHGVAHSQLLPHLHMPRPSPRNKSVFL